MRNNKTIILITFLMLSCSMIAKDIFITPENDAIILRNNPIELSWDSEDIPVDLYYSFDKIDWILEETNIIDNNYTFYLPNDAENKIYFRIEYKKLVSAKLVWEKQFAHSEEIRTALISPDGNFIYTGSKDNTIKKWDIKAENLEWEIPSDSPENIIYDIDIDKSSDKLAVARKSSLQIFDRNGNLIIDHPINNECRSVEINDDSDICAVGTSDGELFVYEIENNNLNLIHQESYGINSGLYSIDISEDNNYLIHSGLSDGIYVINITSPNFFETFLPVSTDLMWDAKISPNNRHIIYGTVGGEAGQWLLAEEKEVFTDNYHTSHIRALAYHPSGDYLLTGSLDKTAKEINIQSREVVKTIDHGGQILDVDYSPSGDTVLTVGRNEGDNNYRIKLWGEGRQESFYDTLAVNIHDIAIVYLNEIEGMVDDDRTIQLILETSRENQNTFEMNFEIRFPAKLFEPENEVFDFQDNWGLVTKTINAPLINGVIYEIPGKLLLSDKKADSVYLDEFDLVNAPYELEEENGYIEIVEWCPGEEGRNLIVDGPSEIVELIENPVGNVLKAKINQIVDGDYKISIRDINGEDIQTILDGNRRHGLLNVDHDISDLPLGVYFLTVEFEDRLHSAKFIKIN